MTNSANTFARHIIFSRHTFKAHDRFFLVSSALVFAVCTTATIIDCVHMSAMDGMSMAGGWTMSMMWMLMPDQTWFEAAASFARMWLIMMVAMMMPVLFPMLRRYRQSVCTVRRSHLELLTLVVGTGYFSIWLLVGAAVFPLGFWLAELTMQYTLLASYVPILEGVTVILAGALQFTLWKIHQLKCCLSIPNRSIPSTIVVAWQHGLRLGLKCTYCCAGLTLVLLVVGVMDPAAMALVAIAIAAERLATAGRQVAKLIGIVLVGIGLYMLIHALRFK